MQTRVIEGGMLRTPLKIVTKGLSTATTSDLSKTRSLTATRVMPTQIMRLTIAIVKTARKLVPKKGKYLTKLAPPKV